MSIFSRFGKHESVERPTCAAVIVAAGASSRMDGTDKQMLLLAGKPVAAHAIHAFQQSPEIDTIVIVTRSESVVLMQDLCREYGFDKVREIVTGGDTRTASALAGVMAAGDVKYIAIHDGARPLVTPAVVSRVFSAAVKHGAAAPGVPLADTVKTVDKNGLVLGTPDRTALRAVQTPQIFDAAIIKGALTRATQNGDSFPDDCAAVEAIGMSVHLVDGARENIKITTPLDLLVAEATIAEQAEVVT